MTVQKKNMSLTGAGATIPSEEGEKPKVDEAVPPVAVLQGGAMVAPVDSSIIKTGPSPAALPDGAIPPSTNASPVHIPQTRSLARKTAIGMKRKMEKSASFDGEMGSGGKRKVLARGESVSATLSKLTHTIDAESIPVPSNYNITVNPLMGNSFDVKLTSDSSIFDLKDAIFNKTGVLHEMQLLGHSTEKVNFEDEEKFLDEISIPNECRLSLSVKATTGKPMVSPRDTEEGEEYFVAELLLPVGPSSPMGSEDEGEDSPGDSSGSDDDDESEKDEQGPPDSTDKRRAKDVQWTTTVSTARVPLSVISSYLSRPMVIEDILHQDMASLRIEISSEESSAPREFSSNSPSRPSTPKLAAKDETGPRIASSSSSSSSEETLAIQTGPPRCYKCDVRCRLAQQFKCKCGNLFCSQHRFADQHACPFDHKAFDRQKLNIANPKVYTPQVGDL